MIVEKAVNMAKMMNIPVIGIVENMAYMACPDCGKKLYPFGEGKTIDVAMKHSIPLLAQLPIDPAIAAACDAGRVEDVRLDAIEGAVAAVLACPKRVIE